MLKLDRIDRHILELMQENGRISNLELAELVGLSSPARAGSRRWRIPVSSTPMSPLLNARQLGLTLTAYIHISMDRHTPERFRELRSGRQDLPGCWVRPHHRQRCGFTSSRWWCGTWGTTSTSCWTS